MQTVFQHLIIFKEGWLTVLFAHLPPLAGNNKVNQWVFSLTFSRLDACHLNNIYLKDSLWERKQMSKVGYMTSSEVCAYRTSSIWLMLSSGLVFRNLRPPLVLLLKGLKAEKFCSAVAMRLLLSCYYAFLLLFTYFFYKMTCPFH